MVTMVVKKYGKSYVLVLNRDTLNLYHLNEGDVLEVKFRKYKKEAIDKFKDGTLESEDNINNRKGGQE